MKKIIYMTFILISCLSANNLFILKENNMYGYIDINGTWIIKPTYKEASDFSNGNLAKIKLNNKWGFINKLGKVIVKPIYDDVYNFTKEGLAGVKRDDKWGMIDINGKLVIELKFEELEDFKNNLAPAKIKSEWGFIDKNANWIIKPIFRKVHHFTNNGLALIETKNYSQKYIDKEGKIVINLPKYSYAESFSEDSLAIVHTDNYGIINKDGDWLVEPIFQYISKITKSNLIEVKLNDKWGFIDNQGKWVIKPKFESVGSFYNQLASAKLDGKYGFINKEGDWVIEPKFKTVWGQPNNGLYKVKLGQKIGLIDTKGKFVIKPKYDDIDLYNNIDGKLFKVLIKQKYGIIDINEKFILNATFTSIQPIGNLLKVTFADKEGYTTKLGKYLTFTEKELNDSLQKSLNLSGIVTIDNMEYQNKDLAQKNWLDAEPYCSELDLQGKGWRLPSIYELDKISNVEKYGMNSKYPKDWWKKNKYVMYKGVPYYLKNEFLHTFSVSMEKNLIYPVKVWTNKDMDFPYKGYAYAAQIDGKGVIMLKQNMIALVLCVRAKSNVN